MTVAIDKKSPPRPTALVETAGRSWDDFAREGHLFPMRCPTWSGAGIIGAFEEAPSILARPMQPRQIPAIVLVCGCGVVVVRPLAATPGGPPPA